MDSKIFEQNAHGDRIFLVDCPRRTHKGLGQMINYHLELDNDLIADGIINYFSDTLCWKSHRSALKKKQKKKHANSYSTYYAVTWCFTAEQQSQQLCSFCKPRIF